MLTLAEASTYFDRTEVLDADSGRILFLGQMDIYDDVRRDSGGAYRRILSVAPGTVMPAHRALRVHGVVWLAGGMESDGLETVHRDKYVLQRTQGRLSVSRLGAYLLGTPANLLWGAVEWVKDGKEINSSSRSHAQSTGYFAQGADVREYDIVDASGVMHLVTSVHPQPSGYLAATCVETEFPLANATLATRVYDPALGKYTASVSTTVPALRVRWQVLYEFASDADARFRPGDCVIALPAGTAVATKDTLTLAGELWAVQSVDNIGGAVVAHARPG